MPKIYNKLNLNIDAKCKLIPEPSEIMVPADGDAEPEISFTLSCAALTSPPKTCVEIFPYNGQNVEIVQGETGIDSCYVKIKTDNEN